MSAQSATRAGRRIAERLMLDTGKALRPYNDGAALYDPITQVDDEDAEDLFAARCKIQTRNLVARETEVGARTATSVRTELHIPADSPALAVGDLWEITAVDPLSLSVVGQRVRVLGPVAGTLKTAARYEVEEYL